MSALYLHLEDLKKAYQHDAYPSLAVRKERIERIIKMINKYEDNLCKVVLADFGHRHPVETRLAELNAIKQAARYAIKHLDKWMQAHSIEVPTHLKPSKASIQAQPKGVVGIMSPWNYPISLALVPAIAALAAGNRVWLKPSERSSRTSGFLASLIQEYFHPSEFCVSTGGADVAEQFATLPFAHLFFTGSEAIGKKVMRAASENLTPVTLELGGKSPAIIDPSANIKDAAEAIIYGKLLNNGQTCIAPDYILVEASQQEALINALQIAAQAQFSNPEELTRIHGMGISKWAQIQAAYELVKRSLEDTLLQGSIFSDPGHVKEFLQAKIGGLPHEVFLCLYLDSQKLHWIHR